MPSVRSKLPIRSQDGFNIFLLVSGTFGQSFFSTSSAELGGSLSAELLQKLFALLGGNSFALGSNFFSGRRFDQFCYQGNNEFFCVFFAEEFEIPRQSVVALMLAFPGQFSKKTPECFRNGSSR